MRGFSFESMDVHDGNRAAIEACREVAALSYPGRRPVVLVGPDGAGKTHLLWSIVKAVRAGNARTGLALVLAREFPEKVRRLPEDPTPIQGDKPAILLVDDLEDFSADAPDLERVVQTFLHHGHNVVLATSVAPERLRALSTDFRALLFSGAVLSLTPPPATTMLAEERVALLQAEMRALRIERDNLEARVAEKTARAAEAQRHEQENQLLHQEIARLERALDERTQRIITATDKDSQLGRLQETVTRLQSDYAAVARERDELEHRLAQRAVQQQEVERLRQELQVAQASQREADERLEAFVSQSEAAQEAFAREVSSVLDAAGETLSRAMEHARDRRGLARRKELLAAADASKRDAEQLRFELEKAHRQIALMIAEMDSLRHEAAGQVAAAHIQGGELEGEIQRLRSALDWMRSVGEQAAERAHAAQRDCASAAAALEGALKHWTRGYDLLPRGEQAAPTAVPPSMERGEEMETQRALWLYLEETSSRAEPLELDVTITDALPEDDFMQDVRE